MREGLAEKIRSYLQPYELIRLRSIALSPTEKIESDIKLLNLELAKENKGKVFSTLLGRYVALVKRFPVDDMKRLDTNSV